MNKLTPIREAIAAGRHDEASATTDQLLADDPEQAEAWLLRAQVLEHREQFDAALEASSRAIALWPDVTPAHRLQLRLAQHSGDPRLAIRALQHLLAAHPDDPRLNSEMGARLSQEGAFDRAIPFLRVAAPALLHENFSIWNYTTALSVTGHYRELIDAQPLLDRMAAEDAAAPYPPYCHLAAAKLAVAADRAAVVRTLEAARSSTGWLDTDALHARLSQAIGQREPFAIVRLDHALARFVCYTSLRAHLVLRPVEMAAVIDSVWQPWFGEPVEAAGAAQVARLGRAVEASVRGADVVGLPDAELIRHDHVNFGFLAEMQRLALDRDGAFASFRFAAALHQGVPFLRSLLHESPFLGVVGSDPDLAQQLGRFCNVADARTVLVPGGETGPDAAPSRLERVERALSELAVPFRGALFLVAVPGPFGPLFCGRIKAEGGIAIDISEVASDWAAR